MKNLSQIILFSSLFLLVMPSEGQSIFGEEKPSQFYEMQTAFENWAESRDLSQEKGWKPYQRWAYHWESRVNPDGSLPNPAYYLQAATDYQRLKQRPSSRGSAWSPVGPFGFPEPQDTLLTSGVGRVNCVTFHPTDTNTLWIGTPGGGVWKSTDNGGSWMPLNEGLPVLSVSDIAVNPQNPDEMYVATGDYDYFTLFINARTSAGSDFKSVGGYGIYKSLDGGINWSPTGYNFNLPLENGALVRRILINPQQPDTLLAAGLDGIWRSTDAGANWSQVNNQLISDIEFHPDNPKQVYAASAWHWVLNSQAAVHQSTDFGQNWSTLNTPIPPQDTVVRIELAMAPSDSSYIYAIATSFFGRDLHALYRSTDGGQNWTTQLSGDTLNILGSSYDCNSNNFFGGQATYDLSMFVDHRNKEHLYVGGILNFGSLDGGHTWGLVSAYRDDIGKTIHPDHHQAKSNPLSGQYYFCHDGGINRTDTLKPLDLLTLRNCQFDANCNFRPNCQLTLQTNWTNISNGLVNTEFYRIGLRDSTEEVIGGTQDNSTFVQTNGDWRMVAILTDGMEGMIHHDSSNILYVTSQYGRIRRSEDGGFTFTDNLVDTIFSEESSGQWVTPFLMHPTDPKTIYAGFRNIWRSRDQGENWEKISQFPAEPTFNSGLPKAIRDMEINPNVPTNIWVIKRPYFGSNLPGELHVTYDDGNSWAERSTGLPLASLYANDLAIGNTFGKAWIVLGGFLQGEKVYFTRTGGQTWENISYNLPNVPINAIEYDPTSLNNTVYIGTDVGIWFIHDGLTAWEPYSQELPLVMINELEIDKVHNKIYAATYGRGVWVADLFQGNVSIDPPAIYEADIQLFPNPNQGAFSLQIDNNTMQEALLEVVDITGRVVFEEKLNFRSNQQRFQFETGLRQGHYFVKISTQKHSKVIKMIIH